MVKLLPVDGVMPLAQVAQALAADEWRFYDGRVCDQDVRVSARDVRCGDVVCRVRVAETRTARDDLSNAMLVAIAANLLLFATATAVTVFVATLHGL